MMLNFYKYILNGLNRLALCALFFTSSLPYAGENTRLFDCQNSFPVDLKHADLIERFGPDNVTFEEIHVGEGFMESGSILFAQSVEERVEILWKDAVNKANPKVVKISRLRQSAPYTWKLEEISSKWHTAEAISLGMDLKTLEKINRFPFRMAGFGWDASGTVVSWGRGVLENSQQGCKLRVALAPSQVVINEKTQLYGQVSGAREFSSGHPAMQTLNPQIYSLFLIY